MSDYGSGQGVRNCFHENMGEDSQTNVSHVSFNVPSLIEGSIMDVQDRIRLCGHKGIVCDTIRVPSLCNGFSNGPEIRI